MIYSDSMVRAHRVEEVLQNVSKYISMIWNEGIGRRKIYHRYFSINRAQNVEWSITNLALWPKNDPKLIFLDIVFDFAGYKQLWWDLLNVDGKNEIP